MFQVIKRDGSLEDFNPSKIESAVLNAFRACQHPIPEEEQKRHIADFIRLLLTHPHCASHSESMSVEDIQDRIERFLCKRWFEVGKAFMLYREQHKQARLIKDRMQYLHKYVQSNESATNLSNTDDNANSSVKNVATLEGELYKDLSRSIQRSQMKELLSAIGSPYRDQYLKDIEHHIIYQHDESCPVLKPYCSAYTLYPLLVDGTTNVDGTLNHAPRHLSSFCGQFQNLVFLLSSQKKGAGAYGEFFNFFSYFCEKEWGRDYWQKPDCIVSSEHCLQRRTIGQTIDQYFQSVTHYLNQPASNRGTQSPFTNFNVFDSYYWHTMFDGFMFPDGSKPDWNAVSWLQKRYMKWLNEERTKTLLTFPVMTVCCLTDGHDVLDKEYKDFITSQWAAGDSFFVYLSKNADSISSCCRLRNEVTDNTFSSTTGLTGVQTGSCNVMTLNLNRIVQDWYRGYEPERKRAKDVCERKMVALKRSWDESFASLKEYVQTILLRVYDYQKAYKTGLYELDRRGMLPQTKAGYISLDRLYCTIGVNGLNEAARFLGFKVGNNREYMEFVSSVLSVIKDCNKQHSNRKFMFNLELVPAESLGVKNYNWDKADGYRVPLDENLYNSYIYNAHDDTSVLDKIAMQGGQVAQSIDGGQASHINLQDNLSKAQYTKLLEYAVQVGNNYLTFNVPQTQCNSCRFIAKHPFSVCPKCGSKNVSLWTRIIGYLRPLKTWSSSRQQEGMKRTFTNPEDIC